MNNTAIWHQLVELAANGGALLIHLTVKATLLLLIVFGVASLLRRSSAAVRHTLWLVGCLGLLLLPAFTIALPAWQPVVANPLPAPSGQTTVIAPVGGYSKPHPAREVTSTLLRTIAAGRADNQIVISTGQWLLATLFVCWLLGAIVVARKLALGFLAAKRLQHWGRSVDEGELWYEFMECASSLNVPVSTFMAPPRLVLVDDEALPIPLTWGCRRPVVLMPRTSMQWPTSCRRAALLHELSHIRRLDWLLQSLASLTCLLYWFLPLTWFAFKRLRLESERATDDHVLATGLEATDYSSSLLEIVRFAGSRHASAVHSKDSLMKFAVPLSGTSKIEMRLRSILDPQQSRSAVTKKLLAGITLVAFAAVVPLAAAKEPAEGDVTPGAQTIQGPTISVSDSIAKGGDSQTRDTYIREAFIGTGGTTSVTRSPTPLVGSDEWREVYSEQDKSDADEGTGVLYSNSVQLVRIYQPAKKRVVTGFKFTGNTTLKDDELKNALLSKTGVVLTSQAFSADSAAIRKAYSAKGLYGWVKNATQDEAGVISYNLQENLNPKPPVTDFKFTGNTIFTDDELKKLLVSKTGVPLDQKNFVTDFIAIRKAYSDKGLDVDMKNATQDEAGVASYNLLEHRPASGFKFTGNTVLTNDELKKVLVSKTGTVLRPQDFSADIEAIRKAYAVTGADVHVKSATQDAANVISYNLIEHPPVKPNVNEVIVKRIVTGFKFSGNTVLKADELQKVLTSKTGALLNQEHVASDASAIQKAYSDKGFAVTLQNLTQSESGVVSYTVQEAKLTQIKLSGLTKTTPESISKLITSQKNETFNAVKLRRDLSRIYDSKLFTDATFRTDDDPRVPGGVIVTFLLKEKETTP